MGRKKTSRRSAAARPVSAARSERFKALFVCIFLVAIVGIVFGQTLRHDFVNYDDTKYITENAHVQNGLNWRDMKWAFTTGHTGYAHPVTWLSHQLDYQLYDGWAGGHHLTSLIFHAVNSVLLFLFLFRTTRSFWPGAFVAALFAIHPLHVESVAWVAERKDVLSGLFFLLTLHAYVAYAVRPQFSRYLLALSLFALGILSKPMLVTVPGVLLLLDYWPLGRFPNQKSEISIQKLLLEKIPFAIVAAGWSVVTFVLQKVYGAVAETQVAFSLRAANAIASYGAYLWNTLWPHDLTLFYPYPVTLPLGAMFVSAGLLVLISIVCLARWRSSPYLVTGWLWFLGMLVPVIGFVRFGEQARADRYTYLPQIGLFILVTWGVLELFARWRHLREILTVVGLFAIAAFGTLACIQTSYWRNSKTVWEHALAVTSGNYVAENNLGDYLSQRGRLDEAAIHFKKSLEISPNYPEANNNLGSILANRGRWMEATGFYEIALRRGAANAKFQNNIGVSLTEAGRFDEAVVHLHKALQIDPNLADAHFNLARLLLMSGRHDEAVGELKESLRLKPDDEQTKAVLRQLGALP